MFRIRQAVLEAGAECRAIWPDDGPPPSTREDLPGWRHPELGPLTGSTADVDDDRQGIRQIGHKAGTVGHPLPGAAIRARGPGGEVLGADEEGRLEALTGETARSGRGWTDTGRRGRVDAAGFVTLTD